MTAHDENSTGPADIGPFDTMSRFRITYDGPTLDSSEMDVRELAPALLAFGDLLDASTRALCGAQVRPQVNVRGSFKTGSFGIDFTLATSLLGRMRDMLSGSEGTALANAVTILTALGTPRPGRGRGFSPSSNGCVGARSRTCGCRTTPRCWTSTATNWKSTCPSSRC